MRLTTSRYMIYVWIQLNRASDNTMHAKLEFTLGNCFVFFFFFQIVLTVIINSQYVV